MVKLLTIMTLLQVFALACETDLKMTVVQRPTLSEEYCLSNPVKYDCPDFMESVRKDKAFDLEEIGPANSFEGKNPLKRSIVSILRRMQQQPKFLKKIFISHAFYWRVMYFFSVTNKFYIAKESKNDKYFYSPKKM